MTTSRSPSDLHPYAVLASLTVGARPAGPAPRDAEPEPESERIRLHQRLLAVLSRRLETPAAGRPRSERAV
jgi:hypothetical protein